MFLIQLLNPDSSLNGTYVQLEAATVRSDSATAQSDTLNAGGLFLLNGTTSQLTETSPHSNWVAVISGDGRLANADWYNPEDYPGVPSGDAIAICTKTPSPDDRISCTDGLGNAYNPILTAEGPGETRLQWLVAGASLSAGQTNVILYAALAAPP